MYTRFSEIPKFPISQYNIHVDIEDIEGVLERYVNEYKLEMIPDFQRGHVWSDEQASAFVEFFLSGGESGRTILFNHPGWMASFKGDFVLVDGLQRLTALRRFVANEIPAFGKLANEYEDGFIRVGNSLVFAIAKVRTRDEVLRWYIDLNSGGTPHDQKEIDRVKALIGA